MAEMTISEAGAQAAWMGGAVLQDWGPDGDFTMIPVGSYHYCLRFLSTSLNSHVPYSTEGVMPGVSPASEPEWADEGRGSCLRSGPSLFLSVILPYGGHGVRLTLCDYHLCDVGSHDIPAFLCKQKRPSVTSAPQL